MDAIRFIFGTYNCQPVGTPDAELENIYQKAYKPFLSLVNRFPRFPVVLYYSGNLLLWIEKNHPEFMMLLTEMVKRKQAELLTGGFYDPVLPLIPNIDKVGQIEMLTTFLRSRFGKRPRGSWLAEMIWEPYLASTLSTCGAEYTFLDAKRFRFAGIEEKDLYYPYMTEDQGKTLFVMPLSEQLRLRLGRARPEDLLEFIASRRTDGENRLIVLIENGEVFGLHRGSQTRYYRNKWLESFIQLVQKRNSIVTPAIPEAYVKQAVPRSKIYFPPTSYGEIMDWSQWPDRAGKFGAPKKGHRSYSRVGSTRTGGIFRQFLTRYPESNLMYSKMMYAHLLVSQIRGDKYRKKAAREELWKGQCNRAYWHGDTGGIYHSHLRKEIYRSLIRAEKVTRSNGLFKPSISCFDFDMDGEREFLYQGTKINAYVHCLGGIVFELDFLPAEWNYADTLARRSEAYHRHEERIYDRYLRKSFVDHFFQDAATIESFSNMSYKELGDFVHQKYELAAMDRERGTLKLRRQGCVKLQRKKCQLLLEKSYQFDSQSIAVDYIISNGSGKTLALRFGSEINLSFVSAKRQDLRLFKYEGGKRSEMPGGVSQGAGIGKLLMQDLSHRTHITLAADEPFSLWSLPVETVSQVRYSVEKTYQSSRIVPQWQFVLKPQESWKSRLSLEFSKKRK
jgi:alpha-amylase